MDSDSLRLGDLVVSHQGRDKDSYYIVMQLVNENYVKLVNGNSKKFANPKIKNVKHIEKVQSNETLKNKFDSNQIVYDSEIYSLIKKFIENGEQE